MDLITPLIRIRENLPLGLPNVTQAFVVGLGGNENKKIGGYMLNLPFTHIRLDGKDAKAKYWTPTRPNMQRCGIKKLNLKVMEGVYLQGLRHIFHMV